LALPMSRADIADYLGLTIETVSRTFTRLKTSSIIALPEHNRVEVIDMAGLLLLAEG
ncbi:MAG: helix-turn-helix domain-containing protein, partial [Alphaproteobacteria bacterium]|nr:helix-turn-helix domain-containing protein [Alphaproteobacteria bacterium]